MGKKEFKQKQKIGERNKSLSKEKLLMKEREESSPKIIFT